MCSGGSPSTHFLVVLSTTSSSHRVQFAPVCRATSEEARWNRVTDRKWDWNRKCNCKSGKQSDGDGAARIALRVLAG